MQAKAIAKFVRYTPRKVEQVLTVIRNKKVEKAFESLAFLPKTATTVVEKVLKSAVANAGKLKDYSGLKVKECWVGNGPILKRMRPGPMGRGLGYKRRTAHLTIVVTDEGVLPEKRKKKVSVKAPVAPEAVEAGETKKTVKKTVKKATKKAVKKEEVKEETK